MFLATHRLGPKLGIKRISKATKCSIGTVQHWLQVFKDTGDVEGIPRSGRQKITGPKEDQVIKNLTLSQPDATSEQISRALKSIGIGVSATTVRRRLHSLGMSYIVDRFPNLCLQKNTECKGLNLLVTTSLEIGQKFFLLTKVPSSSMQNRKRFGCLDIANWLLEE